jgi:anti-sigma-K factor RskA
MTDTPLTPREAEDALAAEYVLGVLDASERADVADRVKRDPAFAARVADWEVRLSGLNDGFAAANDPKLFSKIEARLFPKPARRGVGPLLGWLTGGLIAASVALVSIATLAPPRREPVAVLATADSRLAYQVTHFGGSLEVTRVAGVPAVPGQVHELWVIAPDAGPVSLGLLQDRPLVVSYPVPPAGFVLAVSIEPAGGSPTGAPTGPVILSTEIGKDT